jgi:Fe-S cluster assembly scaffold protein SufB
MRTLFRRELAAVPELPTFDRWEDDPAVVATSHALSTARQAETEAERAVDAAVAATRAGDPMAQAEAEVVLPALRLSAHQARVVRLRAETNRDQARDTVRARALALAEPAARDLVARLNTIFREAGPVVTAMIQLQAQVEAVTSPVTARPFRIWPVCLAQAGGPAPSGGDLDEVGQWRRAMDEAGWLDRD